MTKKEILEYIDSRYKGDKKAFYKDHPTMDIEGVRSARDEFNKKRMYAKGTQSFKKYRVGTQGVDYGEGEFGYQKMAVPPAGGIGNVMSNSAAGAQLGANFGPWGALAGGALGVGKGLLENRNIANQAGNVRAHNLSLREYKRDDEEFQAMQAEDGMDFSNKKYSNGTGEIKTRMFSDDKGVYQYDYEGRKLNGPIRKKVWTENEDGTRTKSWEDVPVKGNRPMYKDQKRDIRKEYKQEKFRNKFGDKIYKGKKEYTPSTEFEKQANYQSSQEEGDKDYYRRKDTDLLENIAREDMNIPSNLEKRRDYKRAMKYSQSPMEIAKEALPQYKYGTAALNALPGALDFFGVDKSISQPISSLVNTGMSVAPEIGGNGVKTAQEGQPAQQVQLPTQPQTFEVDPNQVTPNPLAKPMTQDNSVNIDTSAQDNSWMNPTPYMEKGSYKIANRNTKAIEAEGDEIVMRRNKKGKYQMKRHLKGPSHAEGGIDMIAEEGDVIFPKKMKKRVLEAYRNNDNLALEDMRSTLPKDTDPQNMAKYGLEYGNLFGDWRDTDENVTEDWKNADQSQAPLASKFQVADQSLNTATQVVTHPKYGGMTTQQDGIDETPLQGYTTKTMMDRYQNSNRDALSRAGLYLEGEAASKANEYNVSGFRGAIDKGEYDFEDQKVTQADYDQWLKDKKAYAGKNSLLNTRNADDVYNLRKSFISDMRNRGKSITSLDQEVKLDKPDFYKNTYDPQENQFKGPEMQSPPADGEPQQGGGPFNSGGYQQSKPYWGDKFRMQAPSLYNFSQGLFGNPEISARRFMDPEQLQYEDRSAEDRAAALRQSAAAKKGGRDFYMSRGQRQGRDTQIDSRYLDAQGKINQNEARRFDQINQYNVGTRNQAQGANIGLANQYDDIDARNRGMKQRFLAKGFEQQGELGAFNRQEKFMRDREQRLYDTDMKKLNLAYWKYGLDGDPLNVADNAGPGTGKKKLSSPSKTKKDSDSKTKSTGPQTKTGKKIKQVKDKVKDKAKKEIKKAKDDVKESLKPRTKEEKTKDKLSKRRYKDTKTIRAKKKFDKEQKEGRKSVAETEKMIKKGRRKLSKEADAKMRSDQRFDRREQRDKLKYASREERERVKNLTAEEKRDERVKKRKKRLANR